MIAKNKNENGFSTISVLISLGMLSGLALAMMQQTKNMEQHYQPIKLAAYLMDLKHYLHENLSCEKTRELSGYECGSENGKKIPTYSKSDAILTEKNGSIFNKFLLSAECKNDHEIHLYYQLDKYFNKEKKHLLDGIPITCEPPAETTNVALGINYEDGTDNDFDDSVICFKGEYRFNSKTGEIRSLKDQDVEFIIQRNSAGDQQTKVAIVRPNSDEVEQILSYNDLAHTEMRSMKFTVPKGALIKVDIKSSGNGLIGALVRRGFNRYGSKLPFKDDPQGRKNVKLQKDICNTKVY